MSGIADVQARIGEIQGLMTALRTQASATAAATSATVASTAATSASEAAFAAALAASTAADSTSTDASTSSLTSSSLSSVASTGAGTASATTGQGLVDAAMKYVGVPYVWGGENPATGLDCSGLVQRSMADLGVDVPRVARDQAKLGTAVASIDSAKAGDLLIFGGGTHIGIYVGDGRMIDAPKPGKSVAVRDVFETPTAIRRVLPAATSTATSTSPTSLTSAADLQRYALTMMSEGVAA